VQNDVSGHLRNCSCVIGVFGSPQADTKNNVAGNQKKFKIVLKKFLYTDSFYKLEGYFSHL
jgi:hypothetical protein